MVTILDKPPIWWISISHNFRVWNAFIAGCFFFFRSGQTMSPRKKNRLRWRKGSSHKYLLKLLPLLFFSPFWDGHFSCGKLHVKNYRGVFFWTPILCDGADSCTSPFTNFFLKNRWSSWQKTFPWRNGCFRERGVEISAAKLFKPWKLPVGSSWGFLQFCDVVWWRTLMKTVRHLELNTLNESNEYTLLFAGFGFSMTSLNKQLILPCLNPFITILFRSAHLRLLVIAFLAFRDAACRILAVSFVSGVSSTWSFQYPIYSL